MCVSVMHPNWVQGYNKYLKYTRIWGIYLHMSFFCCTFARKIVQMIKRKIYIGLVSCVMAMGLHAETIRVLRFVPVAGSESEVAINSLQKVVFTPDSVVLIAAKDGAQTPMYKYDYRSILFAESSSEGVDEVKSEELREKGEKFIKDGQLFIRYKGTMYNIWGLEIKN